MRSFVLSALVLLGCNSGLNAPSKGGPAPDYEDPSAAAAASDAGPPENPKFEEEMSTLFEQDGRAALETCQKQAEALGKLEGTIQVHVALSPEGKLVAAEPRNDSGLPPALIDCLVKTFGGLKFPAPGGPRNVSFDVPLRFVGAPPEEPDAGPPADAGAAKKPPKAKKK